jgi:hypothetical protein
MSPFPPSTDLPGAPVLYAESFWAKITAVASTGVGGPVAGGYSWEELIPKSGGVEAPGLVARTGIAKGLPGGPTNPAYEVAGQIVGVGTTVQMWLGRIAVPSGQQYLFQAPASGLLKRGKLDGAMAFGGSAVMSVWAWTGSAEADTGENVTVYDWLLSTGATVPAGKNVVAAQVGGRLYVIAAQC